MTTPWPEIVASPTIPAGTGGLPSDNLCAPAERVGRPRRCRRYSHPAPRPRRKAVTGSDVESCGASSTLTREGADTWPRRSTAAPPEQEVAYGRLGASLPSPIDHRISHAGTTTERGTAQTVDYRHEGRQGGCPTSGTGAATRRRPRPPPATCGSERDATQTRHVTGEYRSADIQGIDLHARRSFRTLTAADRLRRDQCTGQRTALGPGNA